MSSLTLHDADKAKYTPVIDAILKSSDLSTISIKKVRNGLAERTGIDFTPFKKSIDTLITDRFDTLLEERDNAKEEEEEDDEEEGEEGGGGVALEDVKPAKPAKPVKPAKPAKPAKSAEFDADVQAELTSSPGPDYSQAGSVSPFAGKKHKSSLTEDEDARLAAELHAQLNGGRPLRGTAKPGPAKKTAAAKKRASAKQKKSKDTVSSDLSCAEGEDVPAKKKRKANPNNAFMKPLILSEPLAAFLGETQMPRPEAVKRIWAYVKEHGLQDPEDRRYILCDDNMRPVFGDKVHMFTMNKVLATNMWKAEEVAQPDQIC